MKLNFLLLFSIIFHISGLSQQTIPGGVNGVYLWSVATDIGKQESSLAPRIQHKACNSGTVTGKMHLLNNNPAVFFNGKTMELTFDLGLIQNYSLFSVCETIDSLSEQSLFSVENNTSTETVLTNKRLASLSNYKYANYDKRIKKNTRIYSYLQNKNKDTALLNRKLRFGQIPRKQNLPISSLTGFVPEIILYGRNLSYRERLRVESYLAIKYGVSLDQTYPLPYLNSKGDTIWNPYSNANFNQNIAAIGRDDLSGLYQPNSESTHTQGLIKISSKQAIPNNSFLIWGSTMGELRFTERNSLPTCMGREWRINTFNAKGFKVSITTDIFSIHEIDPLGKDEYFWLMIDQSGTGNYPPEKTIYIKAESNEKQRDTIRFNNLTIDSDFSGADVFTLITMPSLFTRSIIISPECGKQAGGKIQTEIVGGTAPYELRLTNLNNREDNQIVFTSSNLEIFENIEQGSYLIKLTDATGKTYSEEIWVSNKQVWENQINEKYEINEGEPIELDASKGMASGEFNYYWTTPDGESIHSAKIKINKAGNYYLSITDAFGCNSTKEISVSELNGSDFEKAELFPNPVTDGWFVSRISLKKASDIYLSLIDAEGKILKTTSMKGERFYWYNGNISKPGIYFLSISTTKSKKTLKIIVQ